MGDLYSALIFLGSVKAVELTLEILAAILAALKEKDRTS
jgi:hypothetical protein